MRIQHNISALNAHRQLIANNTATSKNLERLSSGYRINRAGDDAAGLAISEKMRGQIRGLDQATSNANDGISLVQTAEGALNETHSILQRMRELAVQSANGTYQNDVDRENLDKEVSRLTDEIDRIASSTHFNKINLLDGSLGYTLGGATAAQYATAGVGAVGVSGGHLTTSESFLLTTSTASANVNGTFDVTAAATGTPAGITFATTYSDDGKTATIKATAAPGTATVADAKKWDGLSITVSLLDTGTAGAVAANTTITDTGVLTLQIGANGTTDQQVTLSIDDRSAVGLGVDGLSIATQAGANTAIDTIDKAINSVSGTRADLGALQNRLEHTVNNLGTTSENLSAAESRIRDVDMAKEMMEMTKNNILTQAAQAMLAQANTQPQSVLQLLQ